MGADAAEFDASAFAFAPVRRAKKMCRLRCNQLEDTSPPSNATCIDASPRSPRSSIEPMPSRKKMFFDSESRRQQVFDLRVLDAEEEEEELRVVLLRLLCRRGGRGGGARGGGMLNAAGEYATSSLLYVRIVCTQDRRGARSRRRRAARKRRRGCACVSPTRTQRRRVARKSKRKVCDGEAPSRPDHVPQAAGHRYVRNLRFLPRPTALTLTSSLALCSCWPPVREMRRQVSSVRLVCETVRAGAHLRRVQLRLLSGTT